MIVPLPAAGATDGIQLTEASTLTIENSLIANLPAYGVFATAGSVRIVDSIIRGNGSYAVSLADGARGVVSGTKVTDNAYGIVAVGQAEGTGTSLVVKDCLVAGGVTGVAVLTTAAAAVRAAVTRTTIEATFYAVASQTLGAGTAILALSDSSVSNNQTAWFQQGAGSEIRFAGKNLFTENGSSTGSLTPVLLQ